MLFVDLRFSEIREFLSEYPSSKNKNIKALHFLSELGYKFEDKVIKPDIPYPWEIEWDGEIFFFDVLDSTQNFAKKIHELQYAIVIAEEQKMGRGRMGREWISPKGNLYISIILPYEKQTFPTLLFGLKTALAIEDETGKKTKIKYPNDVYLDGKKVAGIIAEIYEGKIILGIGINVKTHPGLPTAGIINSSLISITNKLLKKLREEIKWEKAKYEIEKRLGIGEEIEISKKRGVIRGIDNKGRLILETPIGMEYITSSDE